MSEHPDLRVGVNLLWLVPGVVGGTEDYTVGLLNALIDTPGHHDLVAGDPPVEVVLFVNRRFADVYPELCEAFATVVAPFDGTSRGWRVLGESSWLATQVRRHRVLRRRTRETRAAHARPPQALSPRRPPAAAASRRGRGALRRSPCEPWPARRRR